jgi:hypothetical protein
VFFTSRIRDVVRTVAVVQAAAVALYTLQCCSMSYSYSYTAVTVAHKRNLQ